MPLWGRNAIDDGPRHDGVSSPQRQAPWMAVAINARAPARPPRILHYCAMAGCTCQIQRGRRLFLLEAAPIHALWLVTFWPMGPTCMARFSQCLFGSTRPGARPALIASTISLLSHSAAATPPPSLTSPVSCPPPPPVCWHPTISEELSSSPWSFYPILSRFPQHTNPACLLGPDLGMLADPVASAAGSRGRQPPAWRQAPAAAASRWSGLPLAAALFDFLIRLRCLVKASPFISWVGNWFQFMLWFLNKVLMSMEFI